MLVYCFHNFKKILHYCSNLLSLALHLGVRKLLEEVTILLTKFTSVNLEDHNPQKVVNNAMATFIPFDKSLFRATKSTQFFFLHKLPVISCAIFSFIDIEKLHCF